MSLTCGIITAYQQVSGKTWRNEKKNTEKYLEAIMKILVENKLVVGHRGKGGGYRLVKAPEEYSVGEIIRAAEGDIAPVACLAPGAEKCDRYDTCKTVAMWEKLDTIISDYLDGIKLTDLISG